MKSQKLYRIGSDRSIGILRIITEDIDAILCCIRIHIGIGAQLINGAHHTKGIHASELSFFDLEAIL